jgi:POT family proton-dependent oligopeptide transporter
MSEPSTAAVSRSTNGGRYPPQIKFIIGNEACERFSYYGMIGILELYLKNRMQMGSDGATQVLHLFGTAVYFLPLLGGWLADRYWGRYWTILSISLFYCLGHATLAMFEGSRAGLFVGLTLLAIGAGIGVRRRPVRAKSRPSVEESLWLVLLGHQSGCGVRLLRHTNGSQQGGV